MHGPQQLALRVAYEAEASFQEMPRREGLQQRAGLLQLLALLLKQEMGMPLFQLAAALLELLSLGL